MPKEAVGFFAGTGGTKPFVRNESLEEDQTITSGSIERFLTLDDSDIAQDQSISSVSLVVYKDLVVGDLIQEQTIGSVAAFPVLIDIVDISFFTKKPYLEINKKSPSVEFLCKKPFICFNKHS